MILKLPTAIPVAFLLLSAAAMLNSATPPRTGPGYTSDAQLKLPEDYREWVYLTTGFDMTYSPTAIDGASHVRQRFCESGSIRLS
jgi:hypothetical protein